MAPSTLHLCFKGKEVTHWQETRTVSTTDNRGRTSSHTITDHFNGKSIICNFNSPIFKWDSSLNPGGYSLPFNFVLPSNIPNSFQYVNGPTKANIKYKFYAKLESVTNEELHAKTLIQIQQGSFTYNENILTYKQVKLNTWCCCNQGECKISVMFPQELYTHTQAITCMVEIDNSQSKLDILEVACRLKLSLRLKCSGSKTYFRKFAVYSQSLTYLIGAGTGPTTNAPLAMSLNLASQNDFFKNMYSTSGKLIDCIYRVQVKAITNGVCMCCGQIPKVYHFVKIVPNAVSVPIVSQAPDNWNSSILRQVSLQYGSKYEVPQE